MDTEGATDRVTPKQKALRAAQNFSAFYIVKTGNDSAVTALVQIVLKEGRRRVPANAEVLGANAAHTDRVNVGIL